jgi:hypothetical protein
MDSDGACSRAVRHLLSGKSPAGLNGLFLAKPPRE